MLFTSRIAMFMTALASMTFCSTSRSAVLVNEPFAYANGPLNGKDPAIGGQWNNHSGTLNQLQVTGGQVTLLQTTNSEDVNAGFEGGVVASASNPTFYTGFDLTVPSIAAAPVDVNFAHFFVNSTTFAGRIWITAPSSTGYRVAVSNGTALATGSARSVDLAFGQTYRVVESYNFTTRVGTLFINPTASSTGTAATDTVGTAAAIVAFALREGTGNTSQTIDNLLVGNSLSEVLGNTAPTATDPAPVAVVFGPVVSNGQTFSATVSATDVNAADILSLAVGTLPAGVTGINVTGGGTSPQSFTVTGTVDYSLNGTTVLVPYIVSDGAGGSTGGNITLVITPEPTTLAALAGVGTLLLRRRN